jgi:hypothetical protein
LAHVSPEARDDRPREFSGINAAILGFPKPQRVGVDAVLAGEFRSRRAGLVLVEDRDALGFG